MQFGRVYTQSLFGFRPVPFWGMWLLAVVAIPGGILLALSLCAVLVSILALLLPTVPVYWLVRKLTFRRPLPDPAAGNVVVTTDVPSTHVRTVSATVIE